VIARWWRRWRGPINRGFTVVFAVALVVGIVAFLGGQDWTPARKLASSLGYGVVTVTLVAALLINSAGLLLGLVSWRTLFDELGSRVSGWASSRLFFVGFLTKFLPGRFIALPVLVRMGREIEVGPVRLAGFFMLSWTVVGLTGLTVGVSAGSEVLGSHMIVLVLASIPVLALLAYPQLFNRGLAAAARLVRREPPAVTASSRGIRRAIGTQSLSWIVSGQHLALLAVVAGAPPLRSYLICVGAFAAAAVAGILVVVVPDGVGVRDGILVAALVTVMPMSVATSVVLASRLVCSVSEVAVGGLGLLTAEFMHRRELAAARVGVVAPPAAEPLRREFDPAVRGGGADH
jgi:hypothetical protein